jgi:phosphoribosylanthranilate isomerase
MKTVVKICGTTNLVDALASLELGADALGFIFVEESKRRIDPEFAKEIIAELPQDAQVFGVFVNEPASYVAEVAREIGLTGVQLHGEESPQQVSSIRQATEDLQLNIIKALPASIVQQHGLGYFAGGEELVDAIMVDSGSEQKRGGTGKTFDWMSAAASIAELQKRNKVIIAGGLNPTNVSTAVALLRPWAVDAVTGLESEPGKKDHAKLRAFISAVRAVNLSAPAKAIV